MEDKEKQNSLATTSVVPVERIERSIFLIRGEKVILDADLAELYGVETRRLNEQVRRNIERFPHDFMFQLSPEEFSNLKSHFATSRSGWGGRRKLPFAFTEHGAIMAASVLNTSRAVEMSVFVVRAFVRLRSMLATHKALAAKVGELERILTTHDEQIIALIQAIKRLMTPLEPPKKRRIGFLMRKGVSDTLKGHKERGYKGHLGLLWLILLALSLFSNTLMDVLLMPPQDGPRLFFRNRYDVPGIWSRWIVSGEKRVLRRVHEEGQERGTSREAAGQATPKRQGHSASCSHHAGKVRGETSWFDLESLQETPFQPACRHLFLYHLGMHRNEEIGKVFGVGYTAVTGAVKRGQAYINSDRQVENRVRKILNDI